MVGQVGIDPEVDIDLEAQLFSQSGSKVGLPPSIKTYYETPEEERDTSQVYTVADLEKDAAWTYWMSERTFNHLNGFDFKTS